MAKKKNPLHPFLGVDLSDWLGLLIRHGGVGRHALAPALQISAFSSALILPKLWERARYDRAIAATEVRHPPLFVLGHWRSGTTFLHNLLSQDPQLGYLSAIQSAFPNLFLTFEPLLSQLLPERRRLMDNVRMSASVPSEEEIAMAVMAPGSFWHGYYFTDSMDEYFDRYVMFEGLDADLLSEWKHAYLWLIKKLTLRYGGKRLVLKNPANTARVRMLLELFPDARFVHIYRDPYDVYLSRMSQFESAVKWKALHRISREQWEERCFRYYRALMDRLIEETPDIPPGRYTELSFESLRSDPLNKLESIYRDLSLPGWAEASPHFERHLSGVRDYEQNRYQMDPALARRIESEWGAYIDRWEYPRRTAISA
ncbi:MAG TPA: sulfotransferase [Kofleriaceae bacterium]|nr:sulfotransferase [Kofleriaceae bacterium]